MPVDPNISLGFKPPEQINPMARLSSTLDTIGKFGQVRASLNANQLFQQTQNARAKAGQILSSSPDLESALKNMQFDPEVGPYVAEIINTYRQSQLAQIQGQGALQDQADKGLQTVIKAMPEIAADPSRWSEVMGSRMAILNPAIRDRVSTAVDALRDSMLHGLPKDPQEQQQVFTQRMIGKLMAAGITPEAQEQLYGSNEKVDVGGFEQFGTRDPAWKGGAFHARTSVPKSLPPSIASAPGGISVPVGGGGTPPEPIQMGPLGTMATQPTRASSPGSSGSGGGPLGVGGLQILSPTQLKQSEQLADHFATKGLDEYNGAVNALGQLEYMENAFEDMAKTGGFLVPGSGARIRGEVAKGLNTIAQMAGMEPPFDPKTVGSIEDFNKETMRMGVNITSTLLGAQREAGNVIMGIVGSVPGVENTYLGGKLVSAGLKAVAQRAVDMREFQLDWQDKHQGNLIGSAEAFNKLYPAKKYAQDVLSSMGMTSKGFASPQEKERAQKLGYLAIPEAESKSSSKTRRPLSEIFK